MVKDIDIIKKTIKQSKKPITQSQISRKTGIGIIEVVDVVEKLEKRGLVIAE